MRLAASAKMQNAPKKRGKPRPPDVPAEGGLVFVYTFRLSRPYNPITARAGQHLLSLPGGPAVFFGRDGVRSPCEVLFAANRSRAALRGATSPSRMPAGFWACRSPLA
ncbi:MAG: hypothetical protein DCC68_13520 [Planctomycetota bacterium]|nr:MAG: hypothetical protein DCC68_13520 [Planctomycetota bacterium]